MGFLHIPDAATDESYTILGYHPNVEDGDPQSRFPVRTRFEELSIQERKIDLQGKGIGPRLYNTPRGVTGLQDYTAQAGLYIFEVGKKTLHNMCTPEDNTFTGKAQRVGTHLSRMITTRVLGLEHTIDRVHATFAKGTQAVLYNQPPRAEMRQKESVDPVLNAIQQRFMVVRSSGIFLKRAGVVNLEDLHR